MPEKRTGQLIQVKQQLWSLYTILGAFINRKIIQNHYMKIRESPDTKGLQPDYLLFIRCIMYIARIICIITFDSILGRNWTNIRESSKRTPVSDNTQKPDIPNYKLKYTAARDVQFSNFLLKCTPWSVASLFCHGLLLEYIQTRPCDSWIVHIEEETNRQLHRMSSFA